MKIKKKKIGEKQYFYLEHSLREKGEVIKKELYLGSKIPRNIEELKNNFMYQIMKEKYFDYFDKIKNNFSGELKEMPFSAKEKYLNYFLVKFTYDTNRIEGSTITLKETAKILGEGIAPEGKPIKDVKETETHRNVFNDMIKFEKDLSLPIILRWQAMLFSETNPDIAGRVRNHSVRVVGSRAEFPSPDDLDRLLKKFISWYHNNKKILHPIELAVLVHFRFVSLHPFTDGNGRISRILMNFVLHKHHYPMLNIKYSNRDSYYNALERAQVKKQEKIFLLHLYRRYLKEYQKYIK